MLIYEYIYIQKISRAVETFHGSGKAKSMLEKLIEYPNVPRKKARFVNFVRNSFRYMSASDAQIEEIWSVIESFDKKPPPQPPQPPKPTQPAQPAQSNIETPQKRKLDERIEEETEFDWLNEIKRLCCKKERNEMPLEKLEKKVSGLNNYTID